MTRSGGGWNPAPASTPAPVATVAAKVAHPGAAFGMVAFGTAINTAAAIQQDRDTFPTLLAGAVYGITCSFLDTLTGSNIGTALAALFLLSSFLIHGEGFVTILNAVSSNLPKNKG